MLLLVISACVLSMVSGQSYPANYDLLQYCGATIYVSNDVRVSISSLNILIANQVCTITFRPLSGDRLVASFLKYNLSSYSYYDDYGNCLDESIQLTGNGSNKFGLHGYCGQNIPMGQYGLDQVATISKVQSLSEVRLSQMASTCIDKQLTCNGYDDCGNNLDEKQGCHYPDPHIDVDVNIAAIVGGSVGLIVLISAIVITVVVCRGRRGKADYIQY
ncbi:hypothetical protein Btru_043369 [Bulinus truncatus]|nr:hypothetical protein Btru_043369 [Bulinus truncatus]